MGKHRKRIQDRKKEQGKHSERVGKVEWKRRAGKESDGREGERGNRIAHRGGLPREGRRVWWGRGGEGEGRRRRGWAGPLNEWTKVWAGRMARGGWRWVGCLGECGSWGWGRMGIWRTTERQKEGKEEEVGAAWKTV